MWENLWRALNKAKNQNAGLINIQGVIHGELGSCLIQDAEKGIILTAHHIVRGKKFFVMRLMGNAHEYILEMLGSDVSTDIAVLRVKNLSDLPLSVPSIIFGDSDILRPGDQVFAVGYPATETDGTPPRDEVGYEEHYPSIVVGIVSGRLRYVNLQQFIQTDAITDGGYSGGGVFNMRGELIATPNEALGRGQSYGIAVNQIISVVTELKQYGKIERGAIGTTWGEMKVLAPISAVNLNITPKLRNQYKHSLVITDLATKSAARNAGMKIGDIITHIDGTPAQSAKLAQQYIGSKKPGTKMLFTVVRQKAHLKITVILDTLTENN